MLLAKSGAWLTCRIERFYLEYDPADLMPHAEVAVGPNTDHPKSLSSTSI